MPKNGIVDASAIVNSTSGCRSRGARCHESGVELLMCWHDAVPRSIGLRAQAERVRETSEKAVQVEAEIVACQRTFSR